MSIKKTTPDNLQVSPSLQIQYAAQVALQRCLILRIDKAYTLYHFPCYLSIDLISNSIFCPTLGGRFTPSPVFFLVTGVAQRHQVALIVCSAL